MTQQTPPGLQTLQWLRLDAEEELHAEHIRLLAQARAARAAEDEAALEVLRDALRVYVLHSYGYRTAEIIKAGEPFSTPAGELFFTADHLRSWLMQSHGDRRALATFNRIRLGRLLRRLGAVPLIRLWYYEFKALRPVARFFWKMRLPHDEGEMRRAVRADREDASNRRAIEETLRRSQHVREEIFDGR